MDSGLRQKDEIFLNLLALSISLFLCLQSCKNGQLKDIQPIWNSF